MFLFFKFFDKLREKTKANAGCGQQEEIIFLCFVERREGMRIRRSGEYNEDETPEQYSL